MLSNMRFTMSGKEKEKIKYIIYVIGLPAKLGFTSGLKGKQIPSEIFGKLELFGKSVKNEYYPGLCKTKIFDGIIGF